MLRAVVQKYRKDPRVLFAAPLVIVTISSLIYYLVQRTKELTPEALSSRLLLFVLLNISLLLIVGIVFVLLRTILKLLVERQRGILGSRFRTKLVATYILTSIVPIVLLFVIATDLLRMSIDRWFNTPVRTILANSEAIAQESQDRVIGQAAVAAKEIAAAIAAGQPVDDALQHVFEHHRVDITGVYHAAAVERMLASPRSPVHQLRDPPLAFFDAAMSKPHEVKLDLTPAGKWIRVGMRAGRPEERRVAVAGIFLPASISRRIDQNIVASHHFEQLDAQRQALKASQTLLFLTVTLAILFGALWTAILVSRRITIPIQALASGTHLLAAGDYRHRIDVQATDEFGVLINSFNEMAQQLEQQRSALTRSNEEMHEVNERLAEERAYLATVLESVSTGIIAFTEALDVLSVNRAATRILNLPEPATSSLETLFSGALQPLLDFVRDVKRRGPLVREITIDPGGEPRLIEASAAPMMEAGREAWVLAVEDLTQVVQAQKLATWSEAATRIAHEIKNPLTPIQLSAERIARKMQARDADLPRVVETGCRTIVTEVSHLKKMVDEFSRFSQTPQLRAEPTAVAGILDEVAQLYAGTKPRVQLRVEADAGLVAAIDREQIRRALINLIDNAIDATEEGEIVLRARRRDEALMIEVSDTGRGLAEGAREKLFLPYFTTKVRGTGLGLAIVHRIVHDHDGTITVHENRPHGTCFQIEIPA